MVKTGIPFKVAKTSLVYHTRSASERSPDKKPNSNLIRNLVTFIVSIM